MIENRIVKLEKAIKPKDPDAPFKIKFPMRPGESLSMKELSKSLNTCRDLNPDTRAVRVPEPVPKPGPEPADDELEGEVARLEGRIAQARMKGRKET